MNRLVFSRRSYTNTNRRCTSPGGSVTNGILGTSQKKREPPKVIQIILEVSKLLFFCCVCMFFFDEGWICTVYIYILGAECGRWKVLLFLLRRQASSWDWGWRLKNGSGKAWNFKKSLRIFRVSNFSVSSFQLKELEESCWRIRKFLKWKLLVFERHAKVAFFGRFWLLHRFDKTCFGGLIWFGKIGEIFKRNCRRIQTLVTWKTLFNNFPSFPSSHDLQPDHDRLQLIRSEGLRLKPWVNRWASNKKLMAV